jgi:hypothetical protein
MAEQAKEGVLHYRVILLCVQIVNETFNVFVHGDASDADVLLLLVVVVVTCTGY